jgi:hypothetical protein
MNTSITSNTVGSHPYVHTSGNLSADGVLALQVEARYGNPAWLIDAHRKTKTGIYRELALMKSIGLEIKRRTLQSGKKEVYARASMVAQRESEFMQPLLKEAFVAALAEDPENQNLAATNDL